MSMRTNQAPATKSGTAAPTMLLAALRCVALILGRSRRERARRVLALLLPPKTHRHCDDSSDLS